MTQNEQLREKARDAARQSYCPYSNFKVGSALLSSSGKIFVGCNVENSSYGLTCCAERNAVGAAIVSGERSFKRIAIFVDHDTKLFPPCGACRQVLSEFSEDIQVDVFNNVSSCCFSLKELLPDAFRLSETRSSQN